MESVVVVSTAASLEHSI